MIANAGEPRQVNAHRRARDEIDRDDEEHELQVTQDDAHARGKGRMLAGADDVVHQAVKHATLADDQAIKRYLTFSMAKNAGDKQGENRRRA